LGSAPRGSFAPDSTERSGFVQVFESVSDVLDHCRPSIDLSDGSTLVTDAAEFRKRVLDRLVYSAAFGRDDVKSASR
jgi:hypothetical protein